MGAEFVPPTMEPTTDQEILEYRKLAHAAADRFADVRAVTDSHRREHGCDAFLTGAALLVGAIAAAGRPSRIMEIGCGLGYTALHLASAAGPQAHVDTIERDPQHAEFARRHIADAGFEARITVRVGDASNVLGELEPPYDVAFLDGDPGGYLDHLRSLDRLLRPGATLLSSNLFLGVHDRNIPGLEECANFRAELLQADGPWLSAFATSFLVSVRRQ